MAENNRRLIRRPWQWLLQTAIFVVIPLLVFFFGFNHIEQLHQENRLRLIEQSLEADLTGLERNQNTEAFLKRIFREAFNKAAKGDPVGVMRDYHQRLAGNFDYILWNGTGKLLDSTVALDRFSGDWAAGWRTLRKPFFIDRNDLFFTDPEIINARKLLGPQIVLECLGVCRDEDDEKLLWNDSTNSYPLAWTCFNLNVSMVVFVNQKVLSTRPGLQYYLQHNDNKDSLHHPGYIDGLQSFCNTPLENASEAIAIMGQHSLSAGLRIETAAAFYYPRIIDDKLSVFSMVKKSDIASQRVSYGLLAAIVLFLLLLPFILFSIRTVLWGEHLRLTLSKKLGLLFVYSNGLPLAILFFIGYDYINQKQFALFDEIHTQGIRFLQNFDERFESEHAQKIFQIKRAVDDFKVSVSKKPLNAEIYKSFCKKLSEGQSSGRAMRFYLIASDSKVMGTSDSLSLSEQKFDFSNEILDETERKKRAEEIRITKSIGNFILASLNGIPTDSKSATEVELIAESVMQKTLIEVQHEFIAGNGKISTWGMGTMSQSTYIDLISIAESKKYDYLLMCVWLKGVLEDNYLNRQYLNANRNISDLQICITNEEVDMFFPEEVRDESSLRNEMKTFTHKPNAPRQFVSYKNSEHLLMGMRGKNLNNFFLAGLFPVDKVKRQIYEEKKLLITAGMLSLLLALALGQLLSHSFLFPLKILASGAEAIRQRDFALRLPDLGADEFGEMAKLFNEAMIDLGELKVAGAVQEHLLPRTFPECGCMKLHGQNLSMGDLGGDYYDYFNSSGKRFSVLIGDVSGRGAGAALIMAMAKAGIMQMAAYHEKPAELMLKMHELIIAARSNSQQFMTFQYLNFASDSATATYTNAGGWPPLIVNKANQSVREISLPGPMLGALKHPRFSSTEVELMPGEAMVLYTDGIVEGKDISGRMLGIEGLKKLILENHDPEPGKFCSQLLEACKIFTGRVKLQDDITVLIVMRD